MVLEVLKFFWRGWIDLYYVEPTFLFTYWGFEWVRPLPAPLLHVHFGLLLLAALGMAADWRPRLCAATLAVGFGYVFLLERANYLNHYWLVLIFAALLAIVPARGPDHVPAWGLWLLRFQLAVVYGFAGLAKLDGDWLLGVPFGLFILGNQDTYAGWLLGRLPRAGMLLSTVALLFDLLVVPALLWSPTRRLAMVATFVFHLLNAAMFDIGVFPWLMLCATPLLVPPDWPRRFGLLGPACPPPTDVDSPERRRLVLGACTVWIAFQVALPLRWLLYPGTAGWTGQGHYFAWRMMLVNKLLVDARLLVWDPATRRGWLIDPQDYLTPTQVDGLVHPENLPQLCRRVARDQRDRGHGDVAVFADVRVSYNGGQAAPLVDPTVDLSRVEDTLAPAPWILPAPGARVR
jgi:vitamin K-dependent gamma-carboxylase